MNLDKHDTNIKKSVDTLEFSNMMNKMKDVDENSNLRQMATSAANAERLLKQLANRNRLMLLCHLVNRELSVNQLSELLCLSQSALSQHLSKLKSEEIVASRRQGKQIFYRLASVEVNAILSTLHLIYCRNN